MLLSPPGTQEVEIVARPLNLIVAMVFVATTINAGLPPNRIAAGDVTASSAVLWARADTATTVIFFYAPLDEEGQLTDWQLRTVGVVDPTVPAKSEIEGLVPGSLYVYAVSTDFGTTYDVGWFRTPHLVGGHHGLRFGVSGDSRGELGPFPSITNTTQRSLDFFAQHNCYPFQCP